MAETTSSLQKNLDDSVGGQCDFPEKIDLPTDASFMKITKRVRGNKRERNRYRKDLENMVKNGLLTTDEATKWGRIG